MERSTNERILSFGRSATGTRKENIREFAHFLVRRNPAQARVQYVVTRLRTLGSMGLAEAAGLNEWRVRQDFETTLFDPDGLMSTEPHR